MDVQSVQTSNANVTANAVLNVADGGAAGSAVITTSATGNTGQNDSLGYADLTGHLTQTTAAGATVDAESQINATNGLAADISHSVQALGNSQEIATVGGSATMQSDQTNQAIVQANGGAVVNYTGADTSTFSSVAMGNNVTVNNSAGATTAVTLNQTNTGQYTQAAQFVNAGNGQTIAASSNAIGNNISAYNENNPMGATINQTNTAFIHGQTDATAYEFGSGSATASGVGNSVVAGNLNGDLTLDNTQNNSGGGVEVTSSFSGTGGLGYDASSTAIAMGNAVTGYACSTCANRMTVTNRQNNSTAVAATSTVTMNTANRSVTGVSTAIGNTATFYVSEPDN